MTHNFRIADNIVRNRTRRWVVTDDGVRKQRPTLVPSGECQALNFLDNIVDSL